MAENALTKLPLAGQIGVGAGFAAVIGVLFWQLSYNPMQTQLEAKEKERQKLRQSIQSLEVTTNKLLEFEKEVKRLEDTLERLKKILPPEKETPELMRKVQYLATQNGLTIKKFAPSATVSKDFYQEWPIKMDLIGTYHNLGLFLDKVGRLSRIVNIGNISLKVSAVPGKTVGGTCIATTYVYVDTPPNAGADKAGTSKSKGKGK